VEEVEVEEDGAGGGFGCSGACSDCARCVKV
jgi:hypothetical protein